MSAWVQERETRERERERERERNRMGERELIMPWVIPLQTGTMVTVAGWGWELLVTCVKGGVVGVWVQGKRQRERERKREERNRMGERELG